MVSHHQVAQGRWLICGIVCIVLLTACTASPSAPSLTKKGPSSSGTSQAVLLGTAPQNCAPGPTPKEVNPAFGPAIGQSPLWAAGFAGPHATVHLAHSLYTQNGWEVKILWLLEPNATQPVTLQGGDQTIASRHLSFDVTGQITPKPMLDPRETAHDQWATFPSHVFVPAVGCYMVTATWAGNTWHVPFTAAP